MKYLTFIRHPESIRQSPPPPGFMDAMGQFVQKSRASGALVDTGGLLPSKEIIGGWAILKADTKEEVVRIATEFMELHRKFWPGFEGESEVRPMFDPGVGR
jgi:hypothetical protein